MDAKKKRRVFPLKITTIQNLSKMVQFQVPSQCDQTLVLLPHYSLCSTQWKFGDASEKLLFSFGKYERREREQKQSKEMAEKATRELEKMQLQEKAEVKYKEWLKKKRAEESEKKKREKEKEKEREAELQEKRERSEKIFQEWLHNARNKPRPVLNGYGLPHRKSTGRPDGNSYPTPAYCNPIPWKPVHVPPPKEDNVLTMKNSKRPVSCQSHKSSSIVIYKPKNNLRVGSLHRKQL
ncbi:coiled-coil domain-containing protein 34 isoform X4 [Anser cygnoides]|uniref:coiled-coil domain-containing protein 34 isoform X4 n=1 Tax=Anser cygnoides TaxID=8845 RepID=UPI0034D1D5E6